MKDIIYVSIWEIKVLLFTCCLIIPAFISIALYTPLSEARFENAILISAYSMNIVLFTFLTLKILQAYRDRFLKILIGKFCLVLVIFAPIDFAINKLDSELNRSFYFEYLLMVIFFILNIGFAYAIDKWVYKSKMRHDLKDLIITKSSHAFYGLAFLFLAIMIAFFILYGGIVGSYEGFLFLDIQLSYTILLATTFFIVCHHYKYKPYILCVAGITALIISGLIYSDLLHDVVYFTFLQK